MKVVDLSMIGETVLDWNEEDMAAYHEKRLEEETVWLTQEQIAALFGTKRPAITKHLSNIYNSGELAQDSTCSILEHRPNIIIWMQSCPLVIG